MEGLDCHNRSWEIISNGMRYWFGAILPFHANDKHKHTEYIDPIFKPQLFPTICYVP